jgi:ParB-like nuclease domain
MDDKVKQQQIKLHPAVSAYRMMDEAELEALAESIKANGLRDPISVGIIGKERWIIDGRSRLKACEMAGIAPEYEEIEFGDEDELRAFVADRSERRNITVGQKAMGYAMLFPEARGGSDRKSAESGKLGLSDPGYRKMALSMARSVIRYSTKVAMDVRDGYSLRKAFDEAEAHAKDMESRKIRSGKD